MHTQNEKRLKRLTVIKLIYAALIWAIRRGKHVGMNFDDLVGYIGHVAYMCMHATSNTYNDRTFRGYDKAVRDWSKANGLLAFSMGDHELNILHFNYENTTELITWDNGFITTHILMFFKW